MVEVTKEIKEYLKFRKKLFILNYVKEVDHTTKELREFKYSISIYFRY